MPYNLPVVNQRIGIDARRARQHDAAGRIEGGSVPVDEDDFLLDRRPSQCPNCGLAIEDNHPFCRRCDWDLTDGQAVKDLRSNRVDCIWCQMRRKRSKEDIFPSWLSRAYPGRRSREQNVVRKASDFANDDRHLHRDPRRGQRLRPAYRVTTRDVCEICNNGWMSRLQNQAKPIIERLIRGIDVSLITAERDVLSRWVVMTFINLTSAERALHSLVEQRAALREGHLPSGAACFVGLMADNGLVGAYERYSPTLVFDRATAAHLPILIGWLVIERACFGCVLGPSDEIMADHAHLFRAPPAASLIAAGLTQISPPAKPTSIWMAPIANQALLDLRNIVGPG